MFKPSALSITVALTSALVGCSSDKTPTRSADAAGVVTSDFCEGIASPQSDPPSFYEDNPTLTDSGADGGTQPTLVTASPADVGLNESVLAAGLAELQDHAAVTSFLVMRGGALVYEHYLHGSARDDSNNVHSASKSVLGLLVGEAIDEGAISGLDQPVAELLPDLFAGQSAEKQAITVHDLLTMSAGFQWIEDVSEPGIEHTDDWLQAIVDLPLDTAPGEQFNYSTSQSHLMAAALAHATGQSLCDYAHDKLYTPLGITAERWGRDPQGYFSGGYNVYLTPRELLRFGQLVLERGGADGEQLIPASWVDDAINIQIRDAGLYYYGYYFWLRRRAGIDSGTDSGTDSDPDLDIAWGYGGQLVYVIPSADVVVVITTNTRDYDPDYDGADLVLDDVIGAIDDSLVTSTGG